MALFILVSIWPRERAFRCDLGPFLAIYFCPIEIAAKGTFSPPLTIFDLLFDYRPLLALKRPMWRNGKTIKGKEENAITGQTEGKLLDIGVYGG